MVYVTCPQKPKNEIYNRLATVDQPGQMNPTDFYLA